MGVGSWRVRSGLLTVLIVLVALLLPAAPAHAAGYSITVKAPTGDTLTGRTFAAFQLGAYSNAVKANGKVTSVAVSNPNSTAGEWITRAFTANKITADKNYDAAGNLAKITDAAKLRAIAKSLAADAKKPGASVLSWKPTGAQANLTVPNMGLYLLMTNNSLSMIVSTKIDGLDMANQTLGVVTMKNTVIDLSKSAVGGSSATVGLSKQFTITTRFPQQAVNPTKLTITDTPTGMKYAAGSLTVKIGDATPVKIDPTASGNGFILDLSSRIAHNWEKQVVVTYSMIILQANASNKASSTYVIDGDTKTGGDTTVFVKSYGFTLKKTRVDNGNALANAGFKIMDKTHGKWLTWNATAKTWSQAASETAAGEIRTDANGLIQYQNLAAGQYTVKETTTPTGMMNVKPSFTLQINDDGSYRMVENANTNLVGLNGSTVTVKNVNSITQMPLTGGFQRSMAGVVLTVISLGLILTLITLIRGRLSTHRGSHSA
ncbi:prealbumin-like fold domain-containing protein [Bifidobacterium sp. SO1]|uniref:prealbumin-like fold domain-containing protein n=1 Tax=Bifidobacterium sp. SO1 TaxID=2809029 RepID=UPI001BDCBBAF|nr:prealbumin-like fold domain-containing protein [Bifidobacterium sp. SO1]MBT1161805.1 isopeptide-forming domain-containing fimbrial protein [Bifidobacterium sp. SO1]